MLETALALLAAQAKTVGLVAGTAVVTVAAVGGGAVALQSVGSHVPTLAETAVVAEVGPATPTAAEQHDDTTTGDLGGTARRAAVVFLCDADGSHGQNVSTYVHSLPRTTGQGRLVPAAARSDCGKGAEPEPADRADAGSDSRHLTGTGSGHRRGTSKGKGKG